MTKSDLRTGHIVTLRNGTRHIVYKDCVLGYGDVIVNTHKQSWMRFSDYHEDMTCTDNDTEFDIMKVETPKTPYDYNGNPDNITGLTLWQRTKKMTIAEIEKALGYSIEVVSDK